MGVAYFLLSSLCFAFAVKAQDCSRPEPGPNMNLKDTDILRQTFPDGTKVSLSCDVGYTSAGGSSVITCTAGSWSPVRLTCERKNCMLAGDVPNGQIDYSQGTQFGDKAVITCNTGYTLVGSRELLCGDQGWINRLPVCEVVKCLQVPMVVNGVFSPNKEEYDYGDVVLYTCQKDYTLIGSKSVTCSEDGTFSPESPTCRMVECEDSQIVNGYWDAGSRPPYRLSSTVKFECNTGYSMKGQGTQICDINGKWSPGLPTCERNNCNSAGEVPHGHVNYPTGTQFGDKAVITCDTGYTLVGSRELFCGSFGWLNRLPVCEVVKCLQPPVVVNGVFSPNKEQYEYGDAVKYSCDQNYTLVGSFFSFLFCSEDGTFKPDPPTCVRDCRVDGTAFQSPGGLPSTSSDAASARAGQQDDGLTFYERLVVEFHKEMLRKSMK